MLRKLSNIDAASVRDLIVDMIIPKHDLGYDFNPGFIRDRGWCVAPTEDAGHFAAEEITRIVPALNAAGYRSCVAVGSPDLPAEFANVFEVSISEEDFEAFNAEFGVLRCLLTDKSLSWAISCNEWFNLFAGQQGLIEQMLESPISPIDDARRDFLAYANVIEQGGTEGLLRVARQYS